MQKGDARILEGKLVSEVPAVFGEILFHVPCVWAIRFSSTHYELSNGDLPVNHDCRGGPGMLSKGDLRMKGRRNSQET